MSVPLRRTPAPLRTNSRVEGKPPSEKQVEQDPCLVLVDPTEYELSGGSLTIIDSGRRGKTFALESDTTRTGRADGEEVQVTLGDDNISRDSRAKIFYLKSTP